MESFAEKPFVGAFGARIGGEPGRGDAAQRYDGLHRDEPRSVRSACLPSCRRRAAAATSRPAAGGRRSRRRQWQARARGSRGTRAGRAGTRRLGAAQRQPAARRATVRRGSLSISPRQALTSSSSLSAPSSSTAARHRSDGDGSPSSRACSWQCRPYERRRGGVGFASSSGGPSKTISAAVGSAARAEFDEPVAGREHHRVVLDHEHAVARVDERVERAQRARRRRWPAGRRWAHRARRGLPALVGRASSLASLSRCASPPERLQPGWRTTR